MGNEKINPAIRSAHVDRKRFMYLKNPNQYATSKLDACFTYGTFMASARQTPAAPADCIDLSE